MDAKEPEDEVFAREAITALRDLSQLIQTSQDTNRFSGRTIYIREFRAKASQVICSSETLEILIRANDPSALNNLLIRSDPQTIQKASAEISLRNINTLPSQGTLDVLLSHEIEINSQSFAYRILERGFRTYNAEYARRSETQFGLRRGRIYRAIPILISIQSSETAQYLAEIISDAVKEEPELVRGQLLTIAWLDGRPKLMTALAWLGVSPFSTLPEHISGSTVREKMLALANSLDSSHAIVELHLDYPTLQDLLISDIPSNLV